MTALGIGIEPGAQRLEHELGAGQAPLGGESVELARLGSGMRTVTTALSGTVFLTAHGLEYTVRQHPDPVGKLANSRHERSETEPPGDTGPRAEVTRTHAPGRAGAHAQADLTSIRFAWLRACSALGSLTVSTPFLKLASTLFWSISAGSGIARRNEPKERSAR